MNTRWEDGRVTTYLIDVSTGEVLEEITRLLSGLYARKDKRYFTLQDAKRAAEKEIPKWKLEERSAALEGGE